ncbi:hypothetical protein [Paracoccus thiocyanatus]|uniref:Phage tail assembly chaperone protein, TAC n=1 Tax=Paracoccus thiocyanatus TaxID=34006 RepID=A0A3D8PEF8_9RHOB|nr:hypothetical protein [Paracoccus thiocyanatus]RDW14433.1 hypothetical protein DIE28_02705 [Paracoccus thiocyanatus]
MADVTGALHHEFGGKCYELRMTFGVLAKLQARHGSDLKGLLSGSVEKIPAFDVMLDGVAGALVKGGVPEEAAADLADDMLTADPELFARLLSAAFPDAVGNVVAQGKKKD